MVTFVQIFMLNGIWPNIYARYSIVPIYHNLLIVMNIHLNFYQNKPFLFRKLLRKFRFGIQSGKDGNALHASLPIHAICKLSRAYYGNDMHANGICHHYHHHHWLA